jgi:diguanylate cyclase (GGDEF)-like protein
MMQNQNFERMLQLINAGVLIIDESLTIYFWNRWLEVHSHFKMNDVIGHKLNIICDIEKNLPAFKRRIKSALMLNAPTYMLASSQEYLIPLRYEPITSRNFDYIQQDITIVPYDKEKGQVVVYIYDQTAIMDLKLRQERKLKTILDAADTMVVVLNNKQIEIANQNFLQFFGVDSIDSFSQQYGRFQDNFIEHDDFFHLGKTDTPQLWLEALETLDPLHRTISLVNFEGEPRALTVKLAPYDTYDSSYVMVLTDVTEITIESKKHQHQATRDFLTNIYNKQYFSEELENKLYQAHAQQTPLSIVLFDIDHFKRVNDTYGHLIGDHVLKKLASTLLNRIRQTDIFARWGGEEFVLLLDSATLEQALGIAENLRQTVENIAFDEVGQVTSSFGVCQMQEGDDHNSLLKRVDEALYKAKANGRNRVEVV